MREYTKDFLTAVWSAIALIAITAWGVVVAISAWSL